MRQWVEVCLEGDVEPQAAEQFMDRVQDFARRFGLGVQVASVNGGDFPGTPRLLDVAVQQLAAATDQSVGEVYGLLARVEPATP